VDKITRRRAGLAPEAESAKRTTRGMVEPHTNGEPLTNILALRRLGLPRGQADRPGRRQAGRRESWRRQHHLVWALASAIQCNAGHPFTSLLSRAPTAPAWVPWVGLSCLMPGGRRQQEWNSTTTATKTRSSPLLAKIMRTLLPLPRPGRPTGLMLRGLGRPQRLRSQRG